MELILGVDDFGKAITSNLGFIDKSLFIKEILDRRHVEVTLITRPRRFGKTLNLSMLQHFLASEVNGLKTQGMFDRLKIAQAGETYMQQQGKYPVIFISFKSIKDNHFEDAYAKLLILFADAYQAHRYLLDSPIMMEEDRVIFLNVLNRDVDNALLANALKKLTSWLHAYHGSKPWILIDEYDTPIQSAYLNGYYEPMMALMRGILGEALKGNPNMHRAVITGILCIAKENLFSGLNNLDVYSALDTPYAEHFGFTEAEVDAVLQQANLSHQAQAIKAWYNGYHMGNMQVYNPWSIAKCVNSRGLIQPYWVNTSGNELIKQSTAQADGLVKVQLEIMLSGQPIEAIRALGV